MGHLLVIEDLGLYRARAVVQGAIHGIIPINEAEYHLTQTSFSGGFIISNNLV
ncbi:MAG: hypothetical protein ACO2OZ_09235 [Acidilobaceae archaeon]